MMARQSDSSGQPSRPYDITPIVRRAEQMLAASRVIAQGMPPGFSSPSPVNFLLELFVAEETGRCLSIVELGRKDGFSRRVVDRWIDALADEGFVEISGQALGLTNHGYDIVTTMLTRLSDAENPSD
ncbi:MAG: hypothetical protein EOP64_01260 [Sphingomonas sp.]|jgi:hypothetical protein|nr:MAG: hypothetical protein EOP64_01260 [Sphingomonas sp.]